jgi:hypothetical protein
MEITVIIIIAIVAAIFLYVGVKGSKKSKNNPVRDRDDKQEGQQRPTQERRTSGSSRLG